MSGRSASWRPSPIAGPIAPTADEPSAAEPSAADLSATEAAFLARLAPPTPTAYHRLNPLTKATVAAVASLAAFALGGYVVPLVVLATLVVPGALLARQLGRVLRFALVLTLPIAISVVLVSVFTRAGTHVLFAIGPFDATREGIDFAGQVLARLLVISTALTLFGLTTEPRAFVFDLERRGLSPRLGFAAAATLEAVPAMIERAQQIQAAQRARGLDTEGSLLARLRGVLPLAAPVILSSLTEVEERSLALEVRAFGRPGRRHLLWTLPDSALQRAVRWGLLAALVGLVVARLGGALPAIP